MESKINALAHNTLTLQDSLEVLQAFTINASVTRRGGTSRLSKNLERPWSQLLNEKIFVKALCGDYIQRSVPERHALKFVAFACRPARSPGNSTP